ncbi:hypothetical protein RJ640_014809, partial [Escallonia rubra]
MQKIHDQKFLISLVQLTIISIELNFDPKISSNVSKFGCKYRQQRGSCSMSNPGYALSMLQAAGNLMHRESDEVNITKIFSGRFSTSFNDLDLTEYILGDIELHTFYNCIVNEETSLGRLQQRDLQKVDHLGSSALQNYQIPMTDRQGTYTRRLKDTSCQNNLDELRSCPQDNSHIEQIGILEKIISKLCFSKGLGRSEEDYTVLQVTTIYETLTKKTGLKYTLLTDVILNQLLMAISTSKEEGVIRASISILSTIISRNKSVVEDVKQKGLLLCDLASAVKRNVHEAATLIYLVNPSPAEIKTLELLPTLVDIVCTSNSYKGGLTSLMLTPPTASLMIIEVLVTAFDYTTNNMHLEAISSPRVLSGLVNVPRTDNLEDYISLAAVLVRCIRFDGQCRKYVSLLTPIAQFISLLTSKQRRATCVALEFFHEILRMPRSSAICLLQQIQEEGSNNNLCVLLVLILESQPEYKLIAANLLLQLDMLEDSSSEVIYRKEAVEALLESLTCEDNSTTQQLSASILSNLGGTYTWTGEPYTVAWLLRKSGLKSLHDKNTIRNFDWSDPSLQDAGMDAWCSKIAGRIMKMGAPVFRALEKGLKSKSKRVSRDCLTAIAWLGCEIVKTQDDLRYSACEILLSTIEQFVHPGLELEERLLACLCIYNYASGKGMQKLIYFSEGVRESLRRLSNITWMAEELLRVADYFQPNKWRISCVHTQILEVGNNCSGAVTALIYYKGQLYSGYATGAIKVWDIKGQTATLVLDMKEHRKAVTCFSLLEPGNCLLSGSADKTIRIWQMVGRKLECLEVIATKESIQAIDTSGELIFAITHSHKMKVFDACRKAKDLCKNKHVKCMRVTPGKVYIGCMDSSIQEISITSNRQQEIKAPLKIWTMQNKPINSIATYKDWLYSASVTVEGSSIKDWRRHGKPQISVAPERKENVLAMRVVEDFIYVNCSSSTNNLQIWLRGTQNKVGRLSAGSKITSLLTANDVVLCGTESGVIK